MVHMFPTQAWFASTHLEPVLARVKEGAHLWQGGLGLWICEGSMSQDSDADVDDDDDDGRASPEESSATTLTLTRACTTSPTEYSKQASGCLFFLYALLEYTVPKLKP